MFTCKSWIRSSKRGFSNESVFRRMFEVGKTGLNARALVFVVKNLKVQFSVLRVRAQIQTMPSN